MTRGGRGEKIICRALFFEKIFNNASRPLLGFGGTPVQLTVKHQLSYFARLFVYYLFPLGVFLKRLSRIDKMELPLYFLCKQMLESLSFYIFKIILLLATLGLHRRSKVSSGCGVWASHHSGSSCSRAPA